MAGQEGGSDNVIHISSDTLEAGDPPPSPPSPLPAKGKGKERAAPTQSLATKAGEQPTSISKVALRLKPGGMGPTRQQQLEAIVNQSFPLPPSAQRYMNLS